VPAPRVTLLGRPGCHLCDDARAIVEKVADDLGVPWEERDITQSEDDLREYWEMIPVVLVDGVQHDFWRVSEDRLRTALLLSSGGTALRHGGLPPPIPPGPRTPRGQAR
jgi:glutaredoxin